MPATTRAQYWSTLNLTRKCLLVLGMTVMSPIVAVLLLIAGTNEAYKFITKTKI